MPLNGILFYVHACFLQSQICPLGGTHEPCLFSFNFIPVKVYNYNVNYFNCNVFSKMSLFYICRLLIYLVVHLSACIELYVQFPNDVNVNNTLFELNCS